MRDDYTPTTESVRNGFSMYQLNANNDGEGREQFDRWLAAHDAERDALAQQIAAVRAWCPGYLTVEDLDAILDPSPVTPESDAPPVVASGS